MMEEDKILELKKRISILEKKIDTINNEEIGLFNINNTNSIEKTYPKIIEQKPDSYNKELIVPLMTDEEEK